MQFLTDAEFADQLLAASERNNEISRHVEQARKSLLSMAAALMLLAVTVLCEAQTTDYIAVALAAFVLGYGVRSVLEKTRR